MKGECWGLQGCSLAEKLQALHSAGTAASNVQSLEGELCPSFPAEMGEKDLQDNDKQVA